MAYNDELGNTITSTIDQINFYINKNNSGDNTQVTGYQDVVWTMWGGIIGAQVGAPYDAAKSNTYLNLNARHMGGWAQTNLGDHASNSDLDIDVFALQRAGDWVLNLGGVDKVIAGHQAGAGAGMSVNVYVTSNARFNTDGSLALISAGSGDQHVSVESGLTNSQIWDRNEYTAYNGYDAYGVTDNNWTVLGYNASGGDYSAGNITSINLVDPDTSRNGNTLGGGSNAYNRAYGFEFDANDTDENPTGASFANVGIGLTSNDATGTDTRGVTNGSITLGSGADSVSLLNDFRLFKDTYWTDFFFSGYWTDYYYIQNAWTLYKSVTNNWVATNNFKGYSITFDDTVDNIYTSQWVVDPRTGQLTQQFLTYSSGSSAPTTSNQFGGAGGAGGAPDNPFRLQDGSGVPKTSNASTGAETDGNTAVIGIVGVRGAKLAFYDSTTDSDSNSVMEGGFYENESATREDQASWNVSGFTTLAGGGQDITFTARSAGNADVGVIRMGQGSSVGDSNFYLYLGSHNSDPAVNLSALNKYALAYGFMGDDAITGTAYADYIFGGDGNDQLIGGNGNDYLYGNAGNDTLRGQGGTEWLSGGAGDDTLLGGEGAGTLIGGTGNDVLKGSVGAYVYGGAGNDTMSAGDSDDVLAASTADSESTPGTTFFVDASGRNTINTNGGDNITRAFDAVYFSAQDRGYYINTVNNAGNETVTMLIQHGATTPTSGGSARAITADAKAAYIYLSDDQRTSINAVGYNSFDVINFYGGDKYDTGYWDRTVEAWIFGEWYKNRNWYTITGQYDYGTGYLDTSTANPIGLLDTFTKVLDWASDGETYYGSPRGIFAPWDPDMSNLFGRANSAFYGVQVTAGYKGYFTFYNELVNKTAVYYVTDVDNNGFIADGGTSAGYLTTVGEATYLGSINGQAGGSIRYAAMNNGQLSFGDEDPTNVVPVEPIIIRLDPNTDSGESNQDGITSLNNLTLTATVNPASSKFEIYQWSTASSGKTKILEISDNNNDGIFNSGDTATGSYTGIISIANDSRILGYKGEIEVTFAASGAGNLVIGGTTVAIGAGATDLQVAAAVRAAFPAGAGGNANWYAESGDGATVLFKSKVPQAQPIATSDLAISGTATLPSPGNITLLNEGIYSLYLNLSTSLAAGSYYFSGSQSTGGAFSQSNDVATIVKDQVAPTVTVQVNSVEDDLFVRANEATTIEAVFNNSGAETVMDRVSVSTAQVNTDRPIKLQAQSSAIDVWFKATDVAGNVSSTAASARAILGTNDTDTTTSGEQGDTITATSHGSGVTQHIYGFDGADTITGGAGNDRIFADSVINEAEQFEVTFGTAPATSSTVIFAGTTINIGANATASATASAVRAGSYSGWTTSGSGSTVIFTRTTAGDVTDAYLNDSNGSTGATEFTGTYNSYVSVVTTNQGRVVSGAAGYDDVIIASGGADYVAGGAGTDTYQMTAAVFGDLNLNTDTVQAQGAGNTVTLNSVENINAQAVTTGVSLTGLSGAASQIVGGSGNDTITGGSGNDTITGSSGNDSMVGGAGNDVYRFTANPQSGDIIVEANGQGNTDTLLLDATTIDLTGLTVTLDGPSDEGIEQIVIKSGGTATIAAGSLASKTLNIAESADTGNTTLNITGAAGTQSFAGLTFTSAGGSAFDSPTGDKVSITLTNDAGNNVTGTSFNDSITGGTGNDTIAGGAGIDTVIGGAGADVLTGGLGADTFSYSATSDSTAASMDSIQDFQVGVDVIDLSAVVYGPHQSVMDLGSGYANYAAAKAAADAILAEDSSQPLVAGDGNNTWVFISADTHAPDHGTDMVIELVGITDSSTITNAAFIL